MWGYGVDVLIWDGVVNVVFDCGSVRVCWLGVGDIFVIVRV